MTAINDESTLQIAGEAAEQLDRLENADEPTRTSFVSWVTKSARHVEEAFRMAELNATLASLLRQERSSLAKAARHPRSATDRPRTIKKYPNRRLYDTADSRYITLVDIHKLVLERIEFVVIDQRLQEDVTRSVLLLVVVEHELNRRPLMSRDFLCQIIRSAGIAQQNLIGSYLEQSLNLFLSQHDTLDRARAMSESDKSLMADILLDKNDHRWRIVQDEVHRTLIGAAGRDPEKSPT